MSYEPPIRTLRVANFRGFRDPREFDLNARSIVVTGPNGTGKTSFFDALQWGLTGGLPRLANMRSKPTVEHVVNQYRLDQKAEVEIEVVVAGRVITLRRVGDRSGSVLELRERGNDSVFGDAAEKALGALLAPTPDLPLDLALSTSGLMQQDVMRAVLEAKPADRYSQLSAMLGLSSLEDFEDAAKALSRDAAQRETSVRSARDESAAAVLRAAAQLAAAEAKVASAPQAEFVYDELVTAASTIGSSAVIWIPPLLELDTMKAGDFALQLALVADSISTYGALLKRLDETLEAVTSSPPDPELLAGLESARAALEEREATLRVEWSRVQGEVARAEAILAEVVQLAALAIPLLTDECPICNQHIDRDHVEEELRSRAEGTEALVELRAAASAIGIELQEVRDSLALTNQQIQAAEAAAQAEVDRLATTAAVENAWLALGSHENVITFKDRQAIQAESLVSQLGLLRRRVLELAGNLSQLPGTAAVERAQSELSSAQASQEAEESRLTNESARAARLRFLADATTEARVDVTQKRLRAVQPLVTNIFKRLDPHPAFKTMEFELSTYYRRGTTSPLVHDPVENISADPLLVFSTSQANIAALAYFLAMGLSSREARLPFLLLDDPVQSMDDVNVLGFADLCRHLTAERQLIISTHERRLARLLERKLAPRESAASTRVISFLGWNRSGPIVEERELDAQMLERPIRMIREAS